jgi:molybdenum cofactor biosynthesis protein B
MAHEQHKQAAAQIKARCAVVTLSDSRTEATDRSGARIRELLVAAGHSVAVYGLIPDDPGALDALLNDLESDTAVDAILTKGGTGISNRDQTMSVVMRHIQTHLSGFGELFRMLSFAQIGPGAMMSRAEAGIAGGKPLFAMPGSTAAVELAMTRLILPELGHLLYELRK